MQIKVIVTAVTVVVLGLVLTACGSGGGDTSNLKQIDQQRAGDYLVTALNDTGQLKQGPSKFVLEFRKASDNKLADVGNVQINSTMPMPGMPPMNAGASATSSGTAGRYNVESDIPMRGKWTFTVMFGNGQRASLALNVQ
ncbi:MAG: FixH family protein [Acidobacteria bacterium]|nr:FixH family protein [Acidobacteriota bacterium]